MASTIKVNNIQNQCGANIANKCGSTITLGASGDTITLACGASQTGFGRTGTVDWDTTAKTASFTAVSGNGYFVNTTSGVITVTLPATPSPGDIVAVADYAGTAATNTITIARNGSNFEGGTENGGITTNRQTATFVYVDGTQGWIVVNSNDASFQLPTYISATGGTETTCGNYKIHTFTGPGTFCVSSVGNPLGSTTVDYMVVAGGGGGGAGSSGSIYSGAGGGAGGYRESSGVASGCYTTSPLGACVSALPVTAQGYPITVGAGGSGATAATSSSPNAKNGSDGSNTIFSTITSTGGGVGGTRHTSPAGPSITVSKGYPGGSGGGSTEGITGGYLGGCGNTPPVSPPQGNNGGNASPGDCVPFTNISGGGGAIAVGGQGPCTTSSSPGGAGGAGATTLISGSPTAYAGGGGAGGVSDSGAGGTGGTGGGGTGGTAAGGAGVPGNAGTTNTGGGGGGSSGRTGCSSGGNGGAGGSGIVIIRYKYQ